MNIVLKLKKKFIASLEKVFRENKPAGHYRTK